MNGLQVWPREIEEVIAPFKVPAEVEFCAGLPRNLMGKVLCRELRGRAAAPAIPAPAPAPTAGAGHA